MALNLTGGFVGYCEMTEDFESEAAEVTLVGAHQAVKA